MPTRRSSSKRGARSGREKERDPAQVELPLDALQQQIHEVLSAELGAPDAGRATGGVARAEGEIGKLTNAQAGGALIEVEVHGRGKAVASSG